MPSVSLQLNHILVSRVRSFFIDMNRRLIKLWPYRKTAESSSLVQPPGDYWFFSDGIGGELLNDITIRSRDAPYLVDRSIFVRLVKKCSLFCTNSKFREVSPMYSTVNQPT